MRFIIDVLRDCLFAASSSRGIVGVGVVMGVGVVGDVVESSVRAEVGPSSAGDSSMTGIGLTTGEVN